MTFLILFKQLSKLEKLCPDLNLKYNDLELLLRLIVATRFLGWGHRFFCLCINSLLLEILWRLGGLYTVDIKIYIIKTYYWVKKYINNIHGRVTIWPSNYTLRYVLRRNENINLHKNLYTNVHRSIIYSPSKSGPSRLMRLQPSPSPGFC